MLLVFFFFKQKTAYEMRISDWSSDVCSSDLLVVPGYLVWCALAYALAGSWLSWRVGRPLVALNAERYAREADFRFALVHTNEAAESIGLYAGEQRSEEHTSELQSLMRISYAVFCLKKKNNKRNTITKRT